MAKQRVHEVAKETGVPAKEIIEYLNEHGIEVKSHLSALDDETVSLLHKVFRSKVSGKQVVRAPLPKKAEATPAHKIPVEVPPSEGAQVVERIRSTPSTRPVPAPAKEAAPAEKSPPPAPPPALTGAPGGSPAKAAVAPSEVPHVPIGTPPGAPPKVAPVEPPKIETVKQPSPPAEAAAPPPAVEEGVAAAEPSLTPIRVAFPLTIGDLAPKMSLHAQEIMKTLLKRGIMITINQRLEEEMAQGIAKDYGYSLEIVDPLEVELEREEKEEPSQLHPRPPVVTIMGHVDHGKTSLLDVIRKTNVTASEEGGITQRIGAYQVELGGRKITFLDTPGHEAFTAMRARGTRVTDVAVLVVAADDGVMPQTVEAVDHAKAAGIPILVAINKIDKPNANIDRTKQQLSELGLIPEEWGGTTIALPVSAKQRIGLEDLLEMILLVADLAELKANPKKRAKGTIIEAKLDRGKGPVCTVLVQEGTLNLGDTFVAGKIYGKVRALINDRGERVKEAPPSFPAEIIGLNDVPHAGDILQAVPDERTARQIAEARTQRRKEEVMVQTRKASLEDLFSKIQEGNVVDLRLVIKADGQGSLEALRESLLRLSHPEVRVSVIHKGVGTITESDVMLASASNAIIIGFGVRPEAHIKRLAEQSGVDIRLYRVIYHCIEDIKQAMTGLVAPTYHEVALGRAEVRQVFRVSKVGTIAGSYVLEGKILRDGNARVIRDSVVIYEGKIGSLRRFKDDVREVAAGFECGIGIEKFQDVKEGDVIEAFVTEEVPGEGVTTAPLQVSPGQG